MTDHRLKTHKFWFNEIKQNRKTWEIRSNDRNFQEGDWLIHHEYNPVTGYTGLGLVTEVIAVYTSPKFISENHVILSIGPPEELCEEYQIELNQMKKLQDEKYETDNALQVDSL